MTSKLLYPDDAILRLLCNAYDALKAVANHLETLAWYADDYSEHLDKLTQVQITHGMENTGEAMQNVEYVMFAYIRSMLHEQAKQVVFPGTGTGATAAAEFEVDVDEQNDTTE